MDLNSRLVLDVVKAQKENRELKEKILKRYSD